MNASGPPPGDPVRRADVEAAAGRIDGHVRVTPIVTYDLDGGVELKLEMLQHTGSFKPRGAFNKLLSTALPEAGVVAASGGNHGLAVAYAARNLGVPAEIFVPEVASGAKLGRLHRAGAHVTVTGALYADALAAAEERAAASGAVSVHAYDDPAVVAGQGTTFRELAQQCPDLDTVLVAVGGGGLIGGAAAWYADGVRLVAVETEGTATLRAALDAGRPVPVDVTGVAADSLGAGTIGAIAFALAERHVDAAVLVTDDEVRRAQRRLWDDLRLVTEPGGAVAVAALVSGVYRPEPGERVGVLVCGANTEPAAFADAIA